MSCSCENHLDEHTCSGDGCDVCVLEEENFIENPQSPSERYCFNCAMKKGGFTQDEIWQLMLVNQQSQCNDKC